MRRVHAGKASAEAYAYYKYTGKTIVVGRGGKGALVPVDRGTKFGIRWAKDRTHFIFVFEDDLQNYVHVTIDQAIELEKGSKLIREGKKWAVE